MNRIVPTLALCEAPPADDHDLSLEVRQAGPSQRLNLCRHSLLFAQQHQRIHCQLRAGIHVASNPSIDIARTTPAKTIGSRKLA